MYGAWAVLHSRDAHLPFYRNRAYFATLLLIATGTLFYKVGGYSALEFYIIQGFLIDIIIEDLNYIEHYGLMRKKLPNGLYEKQNFAISWDSNHIVTNSLLWNVPLHSYHHVKASAEYQEYQSSSESPKMPTGYAGMMYLSFFPPLWKRVMDHRAAKANAQKAA